MMSPNDDYLVELVLADGSVFPARGRITFADAFLMHHSYVRAIAAGGNQGGVS